MDPVKRIESNKHAMFFGLYMGLYFSINALLSVFPSMKWVQMIVFFAIIYFTYKYASDCREKVLDGFISYWRCVWYVVQLFLYASMISAIVKWVLYSFVFPNELADQMAQAMAVIEQSNMFSIDQIDQMQEAMDKTITPINMAVQTIWVNLFGGLFLGLIVSAFVARSNPFADKDGE